MNFVTGQRRRDATNGVRLTFIVFLHLKAPAVSTLSLIEIILLLVLVPLTVGTLFVLIDEGARDRRDARWLRQR